MSDNNNKPRPPRCIHLTCKAMMVAGEDFEDDPDYQAGMEDFECLKSQNITGPDQGDLSLELCSDSKRRCFEEY